MAFCSLCQCSIVHYVQVTLEQIFGIITMCLSKGFEQVKKYRLMIMIRCLWYGSHLVTMVTFERPIEELDIVVTMWIQMPRLMILMFCTTLVHINNLRGIEFLTFKAQPSLLLLCMTWPFFSPQYQNECEMLKASCEQNVEISFLHHGSCASNEPDLETSSRSSSSNVGILGESLPNSISLYPQPRTIRKHKRQNS